MTGSCGATSQMHTAYRLQGYPMTGLLWVHCLGAHHDYQWPDQIIGIRRSARSGVSSHCLRQGPCPPRTWKGLAIAVIGREPRKKGLRQVLHQPAFRGHSPTLIKKKGGFFTRDYESQKSLDRCYTDTKRTQIPAQAIYPAKLSITIDGETKVFHDKTKFTHYLSTNPALQRLITEKKPIQEREQCPRKNKKVIPQQT